MFKRLFVPTALIATLLIIGTGTLQAAPPVDDPPQAFFNGAPVAPGGVIATGTPVSGGCMMPTTAIEGVLPNDFASGEITVSIDEDCQMTFDAFTNVQAPTPSGGAMASSSGTRFKGWAKSELNDPPGIDLASVYVETFYWANEWEVWDGHNQRIRCNTFSITQWRVLSCVLS